MLGENLAPEGAFWKQPRTKPLLRRQFLAESQFFSASAPDFPYSKHTFRNMPINDAFFYMHNRP